MKQRSTKERRSSGKSPFTIGARYPRGGTRRHLPQLLLVAVLVLANAAFAGSEMALVSLRGGTAASPRGPWGLGAGLGPLGPGAQSVPGHHPDRHHPGRVSGLGHRRGDPGRAIGGSPGIPRRGGPAHSHRGGHPAAGLPHPGVRRAPPKRVAMQRAERWGLLVARPLAFLSALNRPRYGCCRTRPTWPCLMGGDPERQRERSARRSFVTWSVPIEPSLPSSGPSSRGHLRSPSAHWPRCCGPAATWWCSRQRPTRRRPQGAGAGGQRALPGPGGRGRSRDGKLSEQGIP